MQKFSFIRRIVAISIFGLFVALLIGSSCRKNELDPEPVKLGYDYFPTDSGATWVYRVDSIVYDVFVQGGTIDTIVYWVKHVIEGEFKDASGDLNQKVSRYLKSDSSLPFIFSTNFSMKVSNFRAQVNDSSGIFVKMVFPPSIYQYWNGNAFNAQNVEEYQIIDKKAKDIVVDVVYDSTIDVLHRDEDFQIQRRYGMEKYAVKKGMIHKREIDYDVESHDGKAVRKGHDYTYTLESFTY
jgi:hypothetical protein